MARRNPSYTPPSEDEITCHAFAIVAREQPDLARQTWHEAAVHLIAARKHEAGILSSLEDTLPSLMNK